jgi:hypothetical protein
VIVVHLNTVRIRRDAKVTSASVELRQHASCLPLTVHRIAVLGYANLWRVSFTVIVVQARQPLVEMILVRVAAALVQQ